MVFIYKCSCRIEVVDGKVNRMYFCEKHRSQPDIRERATAYCEKKYNGVLELMGKFNPK